jgi:ubiquinone/menaquinone biosynthesis C-methylase UbiE
MPAGPAQVYRDVLGPALFHQWPEHVLDAAGVGWAHDVLDVGCGTGVLADAARARVGPGGDVVGIDPSAVMLSVASRSSDVRWVKASAECLPFDDASFDRVVSQFAIMFFSGREAGVDQMSRVLRPGGRVAIVTWASLNEIPGYAAFVGLLRRVAGAEPARAMSRPFTMGDGAELRRLLETRFADVEVQPY